MFDISLDDIEKLNDDVTDVQVTDDYVDQSNPPPPLAGNYRLRVLDGDLKKDRDTGELIEQDGKYPIFEMRTVEIVEPAALTRKVALYQDVRSKPFDRQGYSGASNFNDFLRSLDQTVRFVGVKAGVTALRELLGKDTSFLVQLDWEATDLDLVKSRREAGETDNDALYKDARLRGMKNFPKIEKTGKPNHVWTNPASGNRVEARATIKRYYPSLDTKVKLGAFTS
jgi:hypothetical protein